MAAPLILLYHTVERAPPLARVRGLYTTPKQFEWQIRWMQKRGFTFTTFEQIQPDSFFEQPPKRIILTFDDGSISLIKNGLPIFQKYDVPAVIFPITSFLAAKNSVISSSVNQAPDSFLGAEEINQLVDHGCEIGSHLDTHKPVTSLSDQELKEELSQSKAILEEITGKPVISVAYPYGTYDARTLRMASDSGYRYGLTTDQAPLGVDPLLELPRASVKGARPHHPYYFRRIFRKHGD